MVGTLVFTDTIGKTFDDLFTTVSAGTDAQVRAKSVIKTGDGSELRQRIDQGLLQVVDRVDGVAAAAGNVQNFNTRIIGKDGDPVGNPNAGPPSFGRNW